MRFSLAWLREYVDLEEPPEAIAAASTSVGLAVEGIERQGEDVLLDVDVTTNRTDAMNHFGLARELAVKLRRPLRAPEVKAAESGPPVGEAVRVMLEDPRCLRYGARLVRGVKVGPSPAWLRQRLEAIGHRSINNVVDVTNFVLWETGQPLHAFDLDRVRAGQGGGEPEIRVRAARAGEKVVTLDGVERRLSPGLLIIADARRPIALAGVMGGLDTEVVESTRDVLLESAHFDRRAVRAVVGAFNLRTDASHRFERGADPGACVDAATRAAALLGEVAGGVIAPGAVDERSPWPETWPPTGRLERSRLCGLAGVEIDAEEVERILGGLGFTWQRLDGDAWRVTVPSWRYYDFPPKPAELRDARGNVEEADLFEEPIRHVGMDAIPAALPAVSGPDAGVNPGHLLRDRVRDLLAASGLAEAVHYAFHSDAADAAFAWQRQSSPPLRLVNPLSADYTVMRRSLLPNLVEGARFNQRRGASATRLFEIGHLFPVGADEQDALAVVLGGEVGTEWEQGHRLDLFDLKGVVEAVGQTLGTSLEFRAAEAPGLLTGTSSLIFSGERRIGVMGQVAGDDPFALFAAEMVLDGLGIPEHAKIVVPSRYPGIAMDLTLTHSLATPWASIAAAIRELAPADLELFALRVRYQGPGVPAGAVNTTISFQYASPERSLTQVEINDRHAVLRAELERRFAWRGGS
jgi:phenylalanyl-tRNA synthetase beta chain